MSFFCWCWYWFWLKIGCVFIVWWRNWRWLGFWILIVILMSICRLLFGCVCCMCLWWLMMWWCNFLMLNWKSIFYSMWRFCCWLIGLVIVWCCVWFMKIGLFVRVSVCLWCLRGVVYWLYGVVCCWSMRMVIGVCIFMCLMWLSRRRIVIGLWYCVWKLYVWFVCCCLWRCWFWFCMRLVSCCWLLVCWLKWCCVGLSVMSLMLLRLLLWLCRLFGGCVMWWKFVVRFVVLLVRCWWSVLILWLLMLCMLCCFWLCWKLLYVMFVLIVILMLMCVCLLILCRFSRCLWIWWWMVFRWLKVVCCMCVCWWFWLGWVMLKLCLMYVIWGWVLNSNWLIGFLICFLWVNMMVWEWVLWLYVWLLMFIMGVFGYVVNWVLVVVFCLYCWFICVWLIWLYDVCGVWCYVVSCMLIVLDLCMRFVSDDVFILCIIVVWCCLMVIRFNLRCDVICLFSVLLMMYVSILCLWCVSNLNDCCNLLCVLLWICCVVFSDSVRFMVLINLWLVNGFMRKLIVLFFSVLWYILMFVNFVMMMIGIDGWFDVCWNISLFFLCSCILSNR